jgi:hypothetical protein
MKQTKLKQYYKKLKRKKGVKMTVLNEEIISKVLNIHVELFEIEDENTLLYTSHHCPNPLYDKTINIYEFTHKNLKEWAYQNGFIIGGLFREDYERNLNLPGKKAAVSIDYLGSDSREWFYATTENEAIFKAAQWILDTGLQKIKDFESSVEID